MAKPCCAWTRARRARRPSKEQSVGWMKLLAACVGRKRPELEIVPFDPATLVKIALFNPVVIIIAFMMGRRADQWQKIIVAAFAASLAGYLLYWLVAAVGL